MEQGASRGQTPRKIPAEQRFIPVFDTLWRKAWRSLLLAFPYEEPGNSIRTAVLTEHLHETQGRSIIEPTSCSNINKKNVDEIAKLDNNGLTLTLTLTVSANNAIRGAELAKLILASTEFTKKNSASGGSTFTQDSGSERLPKTFVTRGRSAEHSAALAPAHPM